MSADLPRWWPAARVVVVRDGLPDPVFCADCRVNLTPGWPREWLPGFQRYMVHDQVWADSGMDPDGGWLCVPCLEARLGRPLTGRDLPDCPMNDPRYDRVVATTRLRALKDACGSSPTAAVVRPADRGDLVGRAYAAYLTAAAALDKALRVEHASRTVLDAVSAEAVAVAGYALALAAGADADEVASAAAVADSAEQFADLALVLTVTGRPARLSNARSTLLAAARHAARSPHAPATRAVPA